MRIMGILMVIVSPFIFCSGGIMMMAEGPDRNGDIKGAFPPAFLVLVGMISAALLIGGLYLAIVGNSGKQDDHSDSGGV